MVNKVIRIESCLSNHDRAEANVQILLYLIEKDILCSSSYAHVGLNLLKNTFFFFFFLSF